MSSTALIIFIRKPALGKVKTRLAASVGDVEALAIYKALQRHTDIVALEANVHRYLYYAGEVIEDDDWADDKYQKRLQVEGNLGNKLSIAFEEVLSLHEKAIVIGSDCAQLRVHHIQQSIDALDDSDLVMGPTYDGGYYLLGMKSLQLELFKDMPWSTDAVAHMTLAKAQTFGLSNFQLEMLSDIDVVEDWEQYGKNFILSHK